MQFDLPLPELYAFRSPAVAPDDFDAFWSSTLTEAEAHPVDARFTPVSARLSTVDVYDVSFAGFAGQRVAAWLMVPRNGVRPLPAVVEFQGYTGGRGRPNESLMWSAAGYAHLTVDCRGQVGAETPDVGATGAPQSSGLVTRGIEDPHDYYYRRVFTDSARAVDAVRQFGGVDPERVIVAGGSQGGGISLAVAALRPDVIGLISDAPFLCDIMRCATITDEAPYSELRDYLRAQRDKVERAARTVAYHDGVHFASRATAPAFFSVGLMDVICPPSSVFAAHNAYAGPKRIQVWPFNGHENGMGYLRDLHLEFANSLAKPEAVAI